MITTGRYPKQPFAIVYSSTYWYYLQDNGYWVRRTDAISGVPELLPMLISLANSASTSMSRNGDWFGVDNLKSTGLPSRQRPNEYQYIPRILTKNGDFARRSANGEIVISDYQTGVIEWSFTNGSSIDQTTSGGTAYCDLVQSLCINHKVYPMVDVGQGSAALISPRIAVQGTVAYDKVNKRVDDLIMPTFGIPDVGWLTNQYEQNPSLCTSVLADANTRSVDILTAFAEAPETISSALSGCIKIVNMYKDVKKKEVRLLNKAKRVRLDYDALIRRYNFIQSKVGISRREYLAIQRLRKQAKADMKKNIHEVTSAISDVWLNYRYNIMPNVYLIQGLSKAYDNRKNLFFEWTSTNTKTLKPLDGFSGTINASEKCFIKRKFLKGSFVNSISVNPFLTAWELIPLSFVVDWVINIGDLLASMSMPQTNSFAAEGSTFSWKVTGTMSKQFPDNSVVTAKISWYKRDVINPQDLCGLYFNPDFSPVRQLDALALSWNIALKKLSHWR